MWSGGNRKNDMRDGVADVYLSDGDVAMTDAAGLLWRHDGGPLAAGLAALVEQMSGQGAPRGARIWLGASLCRPVRIPAIAGARSRKERLHLAELVAVADSGLTPPCRVSVDAASGADDAVAVVVEEGVLSAIDRALESVKLRASSIRPWWAEALAAALRANPALRAFGVFEGRALTFLIGEGYGFAAAQTLYPVQGVESASAAFARTLVSAMISPDDALAVSLDWAVAPEIADGVPVTEAAMFTPWVRRLGAAS